MDSKAIQNMSTERLLCGPQVREVFDEEELTGLARTIREVGIQQPLLVRREGSEFIVLDGERRLRAASMAGLTEVPVIIDDRELSKGEVIHRQLIANWSRVDLGPLEKAEAISELMSDMKWTAADLAVKVGKSPATISKLLALLELPESVQAQVATGQLSLSAAYAISQAPDSESQESLAAEAVNGRLTRDTVIRRTKERKANRSRPQSHRKQAPQKCRVVLDIGGGCKLTVLPNGMTIQSLVERLSALLKRLGALESKCLPLAEAVSELQAKPS